MFGKTPRELALEERVKDLELENRMLKWEHANEERALKTLTEAPDEIELADTPHVNFKKLGTVSAHFDDKSFGYHVIATYLGEGEIEIAYYVSQETVWTGNPTTLLAHLHERLIKMLADHETTILRGRSR